MNLSEKQEELTNSKIENQILVIKTNLKNFKKLGKKRTTELSKKFGVVTMNGTNLNFGKDTYYSPEIGIDYKDEISLRIPQTNSFKKLEEYSNFYKLYNENKDRVNEIAFEMKESNKVFTDSEYQKDLLISEEKQRRFNVKKKALEETMKVGLVIELNARAEVSWVEDSGYWNNYIDLGGSDKIGCNDTGIPVVIQNTNSVKVEILEIKKNTIKVHVVGVDSTYSGGRRRWNSNPNPKYVLKDSRINFTKNMSKGLLFNAYMNRPSGVTKQIVKRIFKIESILN